MVHAVWGTKNRQHILSPDLRSKVCSHIKENAKTKGIDIDSINGHTDHLHSLMSLSPELSISTQMQLIKGKTSHWINANQLLRGTSSQEVISGRVRSNQLRLFLKHSY